MPTRERISDLPLLTNFNGGRKQTEMAMAGTSYRTDVRPKYVADATVYCSPDGSDTSGEGTASNPYATPQRVYDMLTREVDFGGRLIKLKCLPGIYSASGVGAANTNMLPYTYNWESGGTDAMAVLISSANWAGGGHLWIQGDDDDPSNVVWDGLLTSSSGLWAGCGLISDVAASHLMLSGIEFKRFSSALYIEGHVQFDLGTCNFVGGPSNSDCINVQDGAYCSNLWGPVNLSGALGNVYSCIFGGRMHAEFYEIFLAAGCTFDNFLIAGVHGTLNFGLHPTIGGPGYATATGRPYYAFDGGTIIAYGNNGVSGYNFEDVLPGNVPGIVQSNGNINGITSHGERYYKTGDEAFANGAGTPGDDDELRFWAYAGVTYWFKFRIYYDTPTAADIIFNVSGPTAPTYVRMTTKTIGPGGTSFGNIAVKTAFGFTGVTVTETSGTTGGYIEIDGIVQNGSNEDYVNFAWDQAVSNASPTTVRKGSYVEFGMASG